MPAIPFRPRVFLLVTWAITVCSNAFYIAPSAVFPDLIPALGITKAQAGSLISLYLLAILLFQLPAGYVLDRRDPRSTIALASLLLFGVAASMTFIPRYDVYVLARVAAGLPVAFIFVPSAFMVSRAFEEAPGRAVGVFLSGPPAGVALGNLLFPVLAAGYGWPVVFAASVVPLLVLVPLFAVVSRGLAPRDHAKFDLKDYIAAFRRPQLWIVGLAFACSYAAYIFYAGWMPTYLSGAGFGIVAIGLLAAAIPAMGILARPIGGHLAETRFHADRRWVPAIAFASLVAVSLAVPFLGPSASALLVAAGFLAQFPFSVYYLFSAGIMPERFGGTAYAFMNTVSLSGGAVSPVLAGFLVDVSGSFVSAFAMIAVAAVLGLLFTVAIRAR